MFVLINQGHGKVSIIAIPINQGRSIHGKRNLTYTLLIKHGVLVLH